VHRRARRDNRQGRARQTSSAHRTDRIEIVLTSVGSHPRTRDITLAAGSTRGSFTAIRVAVGWEARFPYDSRSLSPRVIPFGVANAGLTQPCAGGTTADLGLAFQCWQ
jgi:hypothetical protein